MKVNAYLEITMRINDSNRPAAAKVYTDYRGPFLETIEGALTKDLLIRDEDVQVLHGFDSVEHAKAYLTSDMFQNDSKVPSELTLTPRQSVTKLINLYLS